MSHPIDSWWQAFEQSTDRLDALFRGEEEWDLPAFMDEHLGAIDPGLMWEYGPAVEKDGHRLVITPEADRALRPLVRAVLARAPKLPNWEFYAYRLPEDAETALATVEARAGLPFAKVACQVSAGRFNFVNLRFVRDDFDDEDEDQLHAAFVAAESLLGEETLDRWIGTIEIGPVADDEEPPPVPLSALADRVADVQEEVAAALPEEPWHRRQFEDDWSAVKMEPTEADDYPEQTDLIAFVTPAVEIHENALLEVPFDSIRHSRHGERFCYLKIDGRAGLDGTPWDDRGDVAEAIDGVLRDPCLGTTLGGGTGKVYSYIELALTDVPRAWSAIRRVLQEGGLGERTWLLFHDTDDARLYRGLYDHTPPPPKADD